MVKIHLSKLLGEKRMTQSELVKRTGIRPGTISLIYHEFIRRIDVEHINKICKALDCTAGELIEYIPDKE